VKLKTGVLVVCCLAVASADPLVAAAQQRSRAGVYALEGLGALPGIAGCGGLAMGFAFVALMAEWGNDDPGQNPGAVLGASSLALVSVAVLPAAAAWGTAGVGERLGEHGSTGWAIGGAYAGLPVAVGSIALGAVVANSTRPWFRSTSYCGVPFYVLGGLAIPVGAVAGYNLGAPSKMVGARLQPPSVALTSVRLPDHSVEYGVKVQLAGLRF
jgi:hypothetical protein